MLIRFCGHRNYLSIVISIASQKGGVGKTTTSVSCAAGLAHQGKKVLLIDIESQANSSKVLVPTYQELKPEQTIMAMDQRTVV